MKKKINKYLACFLAVTIILNIIHAPVYAEEATTGNVTEVSGTDVSEATTEANTIVELTTDDITINVQAENFAESEDSEEPVLAADTQTYTFKTSNNPDGTISITGYTGTASGEIVIPDTIDGKPVTSVNGFGMTKGFSGALRLGSNLKSIENGAFKGCSNLTGELVIPDSVTYIGDNAFDGCAFSSLKLGSKAETIGTQAFYSMANLKGSLNIPGSVTSIGDSAFNGCYGLDGSLNLGNVKTIGKKAFAGCKFTGDLIIPGSVVSIGDEAFYECKGFTGSLNIGDSVKDIGIRAFYRCSELNGTIYLGSSVEKIDKEAFSGCGKLTGALIIPTSTKTVGEKAFFECKGLDSVIIGSGVESIGDCAFQACSGLKGDLIIPDSVVTIGNSAFHACQGFDGKLSIGNGTKSIGNYAFYECKGFTGTLSLGKNIETIGSMAFMGCRGLTGDLIIPSSMKEMNQSAFAGCSGFDGRLVLSGNGLTTIDNDLFSGCSGLKGNLRIPDGITKIEQGAFGSCSGFDKTLYIPSSASWQVNPFGGCYAIKRVVNDSSESLFLESLSPGVKRIWHKLGDESEIITEIANGTAIREDYSGGIVLSYYKDNSETGFVGADEVDEDTPVKLRDKLSVEKAGYKFVCWNTEADGTGDDYEAGSEHSFSEDTNLYAKWEVERELVVDSTINGKGYATYSFVLIDNNEKPLKDTSVKYYFTDEDGENKTSYKSAVSDGRGVVTIKSEKYDNTASLTSPEIKDKIIAHLEYDDGDESVESKTTVTFNITVTPLTFSQEWLGSTKLSVEASIGPQAGFKAKIGPSEAKAEVEASVAVAGERGTTLGVTHEYRAGKRNLVLGQEFDAKVGINAKAETEAKAKAVKVFEASAKLAEAKMGVDLGEKYRLSKTINDYNASASQLEDMGEFLFYADSVGSGNALQFALANAVCSNNPDVFDTATVGSTLTVEAGVDAGKVSIDIEPYGENNKDNKYNKFANVAEGSILSAGYKTAYSVDANIGNQQIGKKMEKVSCLDASILSATLPLAGENVPIEKYDTGVFKSTIYPQNYSLDVQYGSEGATLSVRELSGVGVGSDPSNSDVFYISNTEVDTEAYDVITIDGGDLDVLCSEDKSIDRFVNGNSIYFWDSALKNTNDILNSKGINGKYENEHIDSAIHTYDFELGAKLGLGFDVGTGFKGVGSTTYDVKTGDYTSLELDGTETNVVIPTAVNEIDDCIKQNKLKITDLASEAVGNVIPEAKKYIVNKIGNIIDGVESKFCKVKSMVDNALGRKATIVAVDDTNYAYSGAEYKYDSSEEIVDALVSYDICIAGELGLEAVGDTMTGTAVTLGNPYYIYVTEADGITKVNDFSDTPLMLTLEYSDAMLNKAGVPAGKENNIEIFKYSPENMSYISVGGEVDADNNAVVLKNVSEEGQYVLAINGQANEISREGFGITGVSDAEYTGKAVTFDDLKVYDGSRLLVKNADYTVTYKNNKKAGTATIIIRGKGNYDSIETVEFEILKKDIASDEFVADQIVLKATGRDQKPKPALKWNGKVVPAAGYKYAYYKADAEGNPTGDVLTAVKDAGDYVIVITGNGDFAGTRNVKVTVSNALKDASKLTVAKIPYEPYTGMAIEPTLSVKDGNKPLTKGKDYDVEYVGDHTSVGTVTVIVRGKGNYIGVKRVTFNITGTPITKATVDNLPKTVVYRGTDYTVEDFSNLKFYIKATANTKQEDLVRGKDYEVSYLNNKRLGTATIVFTGKGGYTGVLKKTFKITPYKLVDDTEGRINVEVEPSVEYSKGGAKPGVVVTYKNADGVVDTLVEKTDYTLSYTNNTAVNDGSNLAKLPTVKVTFKGNYNGNTSKNFVITTKDISKTVATAADKTYANRAGAYKSAVTLTDKDGKKLAANKDYDANVTYRIKGSVTPLDAKAVVDAGTTIVVTITAKAGGNYTESTTCEYRVTQASIASAVIKTEKKTYTGKEIKLNPEEDIISAKIGTKTDLVYGIDYRIVPEKYSNNVKKGTASVMIEGLNNYGGTKKITFTIKSKGFKWWWR